MNLPQIRLSLRIRMLLGLYTPAYKLRLNYALRVLLMVWLLLPWAMLAMGFYATWQTYAVGDEVAVPWWAWSLLVLMPPAAYGIARMIVNTLVLRMHLAGKL